MGKDFRSNPILTKSRYSKIAGGAFTVLITAILIWHMFNIITGSV